MPWRKLLGLFFGMGGGLLALSLIARIDPEPSPIRTEQILLIAFGAICLLLATPAWRGRRWTLWSMRLIAIGALLFYAALVTIDSISLDPDTMSILESLAFNGALCTIPAFIVTVLFHPSVSADFSSKPPDRERH